MTRWRNIPGLSNTASRANGPATETSPRGDGVALKACMVMCLATGLRDLASRRTYVETTTGTAWGRYLLAVSGVWHGPALGLDNGVKGEHQRSFGDQREVFMEFKHLLYAFCSMKTKNRHFLDLIHMPFLGIFDKRREA